MNGGDFSPDRERRETRKELVEAERKEEKNCCLKWIDVLSHEDVYWEKIKKNKEDKMLPCLLNYSSLARLESSIMGGKVTRQDLQTRI
jgi:hypothetical protein